MNRVVSRCVVAALVAATACTAKPLDPEDCAHGVAVIWSSETAKPTHVELWGQGGQQASITANVQGVFATAEFAGQKPSQWFVSNGNTVRDQTNISRLDRSTCSIASHRAQQAGVFGAAETNGKIALTHLFTGQRALIEIYSQAGDLLTTYSTGIDQPSVLAPTGIQLLALTTEETGTPEGFAYGPIRVLTLEEEGEAYAERSRLDVSAALGLPTVVSGATDATVIDSSVYFVIPLLENQDLFSPVREIRSVLSIADLETGEFAKIELEQDMPYQVEQYDGKLYIAHTYLNPAIRDFEEYRYISRVDPATKAVETFDVGPRLSRIAFSDGLLYVLRDDSVATPLLDVYEPETMQLTASHELAPPSGGHYYIGGLGLGADA